MVTDEDGKEHSCETNLLLRENTLFMILQKVRISGSLPMQLLRRNGTRNFFFNLKDTQQVHYEQTGYLTGYILIDGIRYEIRMWVRVIIHSVHVTGAYLGQALLDHRKIGCRLQLDRNHHPVRFPGPAHCRLCG